MEKISIKSTAINIFNTQIRRHEVKHTNPFGLSFKGNMIQADVFSSSKIHHKNEEGLTHKIAEKSRAVKSAIVGGINNFNTELNSRFNTSINKIVSFGKLVGETTKDLWKKANETNVGWDFSKLSEGLKSFGKGEHSENSYKVKDLVKRPVSELEVMLKNELETAKG